MLLLLKIEKIAFPKNSELTIFKIQHDSFLFLHLLVLTHTQESTVAEHCVSSSNSWEQRRVLAHTAQAQSGTDQGDWEVVVDLSYNLMLLFLQISNTLLRELLKKNAA